VLRLQRLPVNAYDYGFLRELSSALDDVRGEDDVRGLVVTSAIDGCFSAGADLDAFAAATPRGRAMTCLLAQETFDKLERLPFRVVAAITGTCLGGGLELALACHRRIAAVGTYRLGLPEITAGLLPGSGGTQRLPRLIGLSAALDLITTGRLLTPEEAMRAGILDGLVSDRSECLGAAVQAARSSGSRG
jgi:enoyl-CoA hydratase/carnithine racemase